MPFVARGASRQAGDPGAHGLRRRRRGGRRRAMAPFRALATPLADMVQPDALPGDLPARGSRLSPDRGRNRTMFLDRVDREVARDDHRAARGVGRRRCASPSCASSAGRWPACRPTRRRSRTGRAGSWSTWRPSTRARMTGPIREAWVDGLRGGARPGRRRRLRQLPRRRGPGAGPGGLPGRDLGPARGGQAPLRPDQPVPPQPEHPAGGGHGGMTCRIPSHATTATPA